MVPAGRPKQGKETKKRHNVMLEPAITDFFRRQGDGNLSAGIQRVAARAMLEEAFGAAKRAGERHIKAKRNAANQS